MGVLLTLLLLPQDDLLLNDGQTLGNCGFTNQTARPQAPATVGLAFRLGGECLTSGRAWVSRFCRLPLHRLLSVLSDDAFEQLRVEPFSTPPELPDVMKPQDSGSTANEQAVQ